MDPKTRASATAVTPTQRSSLIGDLFTSICYSMPVSITTVMSIDDHQSAVTTIFVPCHS
jgi:hypothetical protein